MSFPLPQDGSTAGPIARITAGKKQTQYNLTIASEFTGAEEMKGLNCLLPRKSKGGKLFVGMYFGTVLFPILIKCFEKLPNH